MKNWQKGIIVAVAHVLIVLTLCGKLLYDRAHRPRVWVRTMQVDPDLPIRGRYLTLNLEVLAPDYSATAAGHGSPNTSQKQPMPEYFNDDVELAVVNGQLVARKTDQRTEMRVWKQPRQGSEAFILSSSPAFFVPEHAETPHLNRGDELWAEVTVPRKGPPRPIQLAVKHGTQWTPLNYP
jgi:uncharacterized membrane-anchored protein